MKIFILSDTHGEIAAAERLIREERPDQVLHLGDCIRDAEALAYLFPTLPVCAVPGNNDWFSDEEKEKTLVLQGHKLFLCHGHTTGVRGSTALQVKKATERGCDISLFGHTHTPYSEVEGGIRVFNPGSLTFGGTYGMMTLKPGEEPQLELKHDR